MGAERPRVVLTGWVRFPAPVDLPAVVTVIVRLLDTTECDAPAVVVAEAVAPTASLTRPVEEVPFTLEAPGLNPRRGYTLAVEVNSDGTGPIQAGDFLTMQSYPVGSDGGVASAYLDVRPVGDLGATPRRG